MLHRDVSARCPPRASARDGASVAAPVRPHVPSVSSEPQPSKKRYKKPLTRDTRSLQPKRQAKQAAYHHSDPTPQLELPNPCLEQAPPLDPDPAPRLILPPSLPPVSVRPALHPADHPPLQGGDEGKGKRRRWGGGGERGREGGTEGETRTCKEFGEGADFCGGPSSVAGRTGLDAGEIVCRVNWVGRMGRPVGWFGGTIIQPKRVCISRVKNALQRVKTAGQDNPKFCFFIVFSNSESLIRI